MVGETLKERVSRLEEIVEDWVKMVLSPCELQTYPMNWMFRRIWLSPKLSMWKGNSLIGKLKFSSGWRNSD